MHVEMLKEWWENADQVAPMRGDLVIENVSDEDGQDYRVRNWPGDRREKLSYVRVLEPKPRPAWHNAAYVLAYAPNDITDYGEGRPVYYRNADGTFSDYEDRGRWNPDELRDVTPLIEAKVTDEMVTRAQVEMMRLGLGDYSDKTLASIIAASLGIEEGS